MTQNFIKLHTSFAFRSYFFREKWIIFIWERGISPLWSTTTRFKNIIRYLSNTRYRRAPGIAHALSCSAEDGAKSTGGYAAPQGTPVLQDSLPITGRRNQRAHGRQRIRLWKANLIKNRKSHPEFGKSLIKSVFLQDTNIYLALWEFSLIKHEVWNIMQFSSTAVGKINT